MTDKLLPCPFCGGDADYLKVYAPKHEEGHDNRWRVRCEHGCGAMVPSLIGKDKAAFAWNRRDFSPATIVAGVVSEICRQVTETAPPETPVQAEAAEIEAHVRDTEHSISQGARTSTHRFSLSPSPRENSPVARAITALNDWLHIYAPDECGEALVAASKKRILDHGGTLAYIAEVTAGLRSIAQGASPETPLQGDSLKNALEMTGCDNEADLIDMANVGNSLMERIDSLVGMPGPYFRWSPADDPAEIVFDLFNDLDELREQITKLRAALEPFARFRTPNQVGSYEDRIRTHFSPENFDAARAALATEGKS